MNSIDPQRLRAKHFLQEHSLVPFDPFAQFRMTDFHVALITSRAQNIGEAIARTFAVADTEVMIADLNGEKAVGSPPTIWQF